MNKEKKYYLAFNLFSDFGPITFAKIITVFSSAKAAWLAPKTSWQKLKLKQRIVNNFFNFKKTLNIEKDIAFDNNILLRMPGFRSKEKIEIITWKDKAYPKKLKNIYAAPPLLYCLGNIKLLKKPSVAIVGSRQITNYGKQVTEKLTREIVDLKIVIVSGIAKGVDSVAHKTCLDSNGQTIAVLGSGINIVYPDKNKWLYQQIIKKSGLIISEFPPNTPPKAANFPQRNRIVAGLSKVVIVTQAKIKSGSLITARLAADMGIDVVAVPGPIDNLFCQGTNWLIKQGCSPITSVNDLSFLLKNNQPD